MSDNDLVKELRDRTGISVMQCKTALEEAGGDMEKALTLLKEKGASIAAKKGDRTLAAGTVAAYVHSTKEVASMVVLLAETDFVSKNEEFVKLAHDLAMHISATNPETIAALLEEPFIKDPSQTVKGLLDAAMQKFGERIEIGDFARKSAK